MIQIEDEELYEEFEYLEIDLEDSLENSTASDWYLEELRCLYD